MTSDSDSNVAAVGSGFGSPGSIPECAPTAATRVLLSMSPREAELVRFALSDSIKTWGALIKHMPESQTAKLKSDLLALGPVLDRLMDAELAL